MPNSTFKVSYQGQPGAHTESALAALFPHAEPLPCPTFAETFAALENGNADRAVIAIENRIMGRVIDVHSLMLATNLHIVAEHFHPIVHHLLAIPGTRINQVTTALSQKEALAQCGTFLSAHGIAQSAYHDTAAAAAEVARRADPALAAIASERAGELYGLASLAANIADTANNITRFLVLAREPAPLPPAGTPVVTTLLFTLRSVPAALYKALGGFATNGINITKIESYLSPENFTSASFYIDVEARPDSVAMQHALDELRFFSTTLRVLGAYARAPAATVLSGPNA